MSTPHVECTVELRTPCCSAAHCGDVKFLVVDSDGVRLLDRHCFAVLGALLRIDRDPSISIVRSFDRVRIDQSVRNLARITSSGLVRLAIKNDWMDLGAR